MLKVSKAQNADVMTITLSGTIDDGDDFDSLISSVGPKAVFDTAKISRINSIGVKNWIKFFETLTKKKVSFAFDSLSSALVEQVNMIRNFACGGEIRSIIAVFRCEKCEHNVDQRLTTKSLIESKFVLPTVKCPKCGQNAEFDDMPEECFRFLQEPQ